MKINKKFALLIGVSFISLAPMFGNAQQVKTWDYANLSELSLISWGPRFVDVQPAKPWEYTNFGTANFNHSRYDVKDLGASYIKFSNNVNLVVKPTQFQTREIIISVNFGEGRLGLASQNLDNLIGTSLVLSKSYIDGGLGKLTNSEIRKTLEGKSPYVNFNILPDSFELETLATRESLETKMQLLAAYYTDPAWRKGGFYRFKASQYEFYDEINLQHPSLVWELNSDLVLFENPDPKKFKSPTEEEFEKLDLETAKTAYQNAIKNPAMEIVVVGNITVAAAIKAVGSTFGALPKFADKPDERASERNMKFPSARKNTTLYRRGNKERSDVKIYWPARDYGDGKEVAKISILLDVLRVRLTEVLGEKFGYVNRPLVGLNASKIYKGYGTISVQLFPKPEEADKYLSEIEKITAEFVEGKINADLFNRVKNPPKANFVVLKSNRTWKLTLQGTSFNKNSLMIALGGNKHYEQGTLEENTLEKNALEETTLEELKALAKQYFNPQKAQIVKILPKAQ